MHGDELWDRFEANSYSLGREGRFGCAGQALRLCVEISVQDVAMNRKFPYLGLVVLWYLEPVHHIDCERNVGLTIVVEIILYLSFRIALVCCA